MSISEETLMAFVDGELEAAEANRVAQALEADPALAARTARMKAVRDILHEGLASVVDEPLPARLLAAARARTAQASMLVRLAAAARMPAPAWTTLAAGVAGLIIGVGAIQVGSRPSLIGDDLFAKAALAQALDATASGRAFARGRTVVAPLYSFRAEDRRLCRVFHAEDIAVSVDGAACREENGWRMLALAPAARRGEGFRLADGEEPAAVAAAVEEAWTGALLDEADERAAMASGWRGTIEVE